MVKIDMSGNGFRMSFSAPGHRFSVQAASVDEMTAALHHYYGKHVNGTRFDTCPICKKYSKGGHNA